MRQTPYHCHIWYTVCILCDKQPYLDTNVYFLQLCQIIFLYYYCRSQLAPSWSVKDKSNSVVCQKKKNLSSLSSQLAAEEAYTTVSCNKSVVLSNRLSRWASKSENKKKTCFDAGWPWGKRKSRLLWLDGIFQKSLYFLRCGSVLTVERKS